MKYKELEILNKMIANAKAKIDNYTMSGHTATSIWEIKDDYAKFIEGLETFVKYHPPVDVVLDAQPERKDQNA